MTTLPKRRKNSRSRLWWILAVVAVAIGIGTFIYIRNQKNLAAANQYETVPVQNGNLIATIGATGTIHSNQSAILSWKLAGTIGSINIKPGDSVKTNDILAGLLNDATQSALETNLVTAQENLAELTSPEAIANAQLAVTTAEKNVTNARINNNNQQYWKNDALIQNYYASYVIAKDNLDRAQSAYDRANVGEYINNAGEAALYQALYNAKVAYDNAHFYFSLYSQPPTQRQVNEAKANLDFAEATLTNAKIYLSALTGGTIPLDATGADLFKLNQAKLAVQNAQDNLDNLRLVAPFAGTITEVDGMIGDQVSPGTPAFRIDDLSQMKVDVQVSEVDINNVQVGQPVVLTFDAVSGKSYNGKVVQVAQVGDVVQGAVNFTVTVVVTDPDVSVKPGMTAAVTITVKQLQNVILVPNRAVRLINDQRVVYILRNSSVVQVNVTLGASSDTLSEVVKSDLKLGDLVVLNPPSILFSPENHPTGGSAFGGGF